MSSTELRELLTGLARQYPAHLVQSQLEDIPRIAFHIEYLLQACGSSHSAKPALCDLGGGIGLFSVGCAAAGCKRVVLIDDFRDRINQQQDDPVLSLHKKYGVEVVSRDVVAEGIADLGGGFDAITSFDSMEHWHHSPKKLFAQVVEALNPGGVFFLGVPNCVNARKRLTVPFGIGKWSSMESWYEDEVFRAHVREPDVDDLRYIARDMKLVDVKILGRNWLGLTHCQRSVRMIAPFFDYPLRLNPSLCSDIYLVGKKRQAV
jgi:2-polyprenyl-3-methyl-5-hydroxy-6-metoxy-1,4-benzoquinol methylase